MSTDVVVYISAASPMLTYSPWRSGSIGSSWAQISTGASICQGSITYSVQLSGVYFTDLAFVWSASKSHVVQVGLDGALQKADASTGIATLSSTFGNHTAMFETSCSKCASSVEFVFIGAKMSTEVVASGTAMNATLDDTSSTIQYSGFTSTLSTNSSINHLSSGTFYQNTVSYTTSAGATARFTFSGSALYIFGMTGPSCGVFQITIDDEVIGTYNANTTYDTYGTLLFFTTHLSSTSQHAAQIANQDGSLLAFDYAVAVSASSVSGGTNDSPTTIGSSPFVTVTSGAATTTNSQSNGNSGAVIGGVLGTLAGLTLLFFWYRYHLWQKAGGEGDCMTALCGPRRRPVAKKKDEEFKLWPMLKFRPKYAT